MLWRSCKAQTRAENAVAIQRMVTFQLLFARLLALVSLILMDIPSVFDIGISEPAGLSVLWYPRRPPRF